MKKVFLLLTAIVSLIATSCQPCEQQCKFKEGDEIEMIEKSIINNDGQIIEVDRNMDCTCEYTVKYSNMLNFTVEDTFEEFELRKK